MRTKPYVQKPWAAGAFVSWTHDRYEANEHERHGIVWSAGPQPATVWVVPETSLEGEAPAVLVRFSRKHDRAWSDSTVMQLSTAEYQATLAEAYRQVIGEPSKWNTSLHGRAESRAQLMLAADRAA